MKHSYASLFCLLTLALALPVTEANGQIHHTKGTIKGTIAVIKDSGAAIAAIEVDENTYWLNKGQVDYVDQNGQARSSADLRLGREVEIEWKEVPVANKVERVARKIVFRVPRSVPPIPKVDELVRARRGLISGELDAEIENRRQSVNENSWWNRLILERLSFQASAGRGLTLSDIRGREITVTRTDNFTASYQFTVSIPLSAFSKQVFRRNQSENSAKIVKERKNRSLEETEIKIRSLYSDLSKAKDTYLECQTESGCRDSGYEMQKHALELLVRAGMEQTDDFALWQKFLP